MLSGVPMRIGKGYSLRANDGAQHEHYTEQTLCRREPFFRRKHPEEAASIPQFAVAANRKDAGVLIEVTRNQEFPATVSSAK
jgi:hypothetical protein